MGWIIMFYGRERELRLLEDRFNSGRFEFIPVYGRRRVGKTRLLREFLKGREGIFFTAKSTNLKSNMDELASKVYGANVSATLESILATIEERSRDRRFVLIIDEYPRLLHRSGHVGDVLQEFIDRIHDDSKLFLILCGSSMSIMEHEVLGYRSPLYGRRTGSLKLLPLDVWGSMEILNGFCREDALRIYGMVGGIPMYLCLFDPMRSLKENLIRLFLNEDSFFRNEHLMTLIEEFERPSTYYSLLGAVASGRTRINEMSDLIDLDAPTISKYLKRLESIDLIVKRRPVDNPDGKHTLYMISDPFLRFQFSRILPVLDDTGPDSYGDLADRILASFDSDMGHVFESICAEHLHRVHPGRIGVWWGPDPSTKRMEEIDLISTRESDGKRAGWFAECKFRSSPVGKDVVETLIHRISLVKGYDETYPVIYSKMGFNESLSGCEGVELYTIDDILNP